ncbi:MAG: class I SAM-dependent methyltransferase [Cyanothece sp. SIO1E1]|nr:class I SAM-dependent methyltransferase [Cyanothece sp. SIO1E1]
MKQLLKQYAQPVRTLLKPVAQQVGQLSTRSVLDHLDTIDDGHIQRVARVLHRSRSNQLPDGNALIARIEAQRQLLLACKDPLIDGSFAAPGLHDQGQTIRAVCHISKPRRSGTLLYLLVREFQPTVVIELGTNIGISASYLAAALQMQGHGKLITFEVSPYRQRLAQDLHQTLGLSNVQYALGLFEDTLQPTLNTLEPVDFAFIDGHHQYRSTLDYFNLVMDCAQNNSVFIFDDIRWSSGMWRAWNQIKCDPRVVVAVDLDDIGLCIAQKAGIHKASYAIPRIFY